MVKMTRNNALRIACVLALATAFGCSVINSFDAVKPASKDGGAGGSSGTAGTGGTSSGGTAGTDASAGAGGTSGSGGGGTAGTGGTAGAGGSAGSAGTGGTAGSDAGPGKPGLVVVSGFNGQGTAVLSALDPYTGKQIAADTQTYYAKAIAYDAQRDIWFVFTTPLGGTTTLSVRTFDKSKKKWNVLQTLQVPRPRGAEVVALLNQYILYASSIPQEASQPVEGFTVLDITNPNAVTRVGAAQVAALPKTLIGMNAWPATGGTGGGTATLIVEGTCSQQDGGTLDCPIELTTARVDANGNLTVDSAPYKQVEMIPQTSRPAFTSDHVSGLEADILILPPLFSGDKGHVRTFSKFDHSEQGSSIDFNIGGEQLSAAAYDPCRDLVIATEVATPSKQGIYVIPRTAGGTPTSLTLTTSAQSVFYEPYTTSVIRPFADKSNPQLTAYTLGGDKTTPTLSPRTTPPWNPPPLDPRLVVVESPANPLASCN